VKKDPGFAPQQGQTNHAMLHGLNCKNYTRLKKLASANAGFCQRQRKKTFFITKDASK
jgi:hypothetical protein